MSPPVVLIAHNIRSLWNIGSFFRIADCFGISHIHLTGYTATPPRDEISKTALHAEEWIPWSKAENPMEVIAERKKQGYDILALEITNGSSALSRYEPKKPMCLVVGHEVLGVSDEILRAADHVLHIPMKGRKESLNVSVALGIALYHLTNGG